MIGRRMYGGTSTYVPLKVNQAGIIPVIFASSLLYLPQLLSSNVWTSNAAFTRFINTYLVRPERPGLPEVYFALIVFFTYFYVAITFNPVEVSDNMKKYGGFVPGIRPGRATAETSTSSCRASPPSAPSTSASSPCCPTCCSAYGQRPDRAVRRDRDPDHRRGRARDGEAGGEPS